MTSSNPQRRAARAARRWHDRVREAGTILAIRIARIEAGLAFQTDAAERMAMLTRLRQRLGRIVDRYDSIRW